MAATQTKKQKVATATVTLFAYINCPECDGQVAIVNSRDWAGVGEQLECPDCGATVKKPRNPFRK